MSAGGSTAVDWDRLAPAYGRQVWLERSSLRTLLDMLAPRPRERLLDVGTGSAELLRTLSRRADRPAEAVGIDPCRRMLEQAPELPDSWSLRQASGEALPFADDSVDLLTVSYVLHVLDSGTREKVLSEARRVLKPGGRLGAVTIAPPLSAPTRVATAPIRWAARKYPSRLIGLRPLDPGSDLARAGLAEVGRRRDFRGYPALCIVAAEPA